MSAERVMAISTSAAAGMGSMTEPTMVARKRPARRGPPGLIFDDQGIASRKVDVVKNGVLKGFLMDRNPIAGFPRSNGHGRREMGHWVEARMGNLITQASQTVPYARLRRMLIEEIKRQNKPYGLVFDDISGGETLTSRGSGQTINVFPLLVYKVYPDGRPDEVIRGVNIIGTPIIALSRVAAAADDYDVFNGVCGSSSGWVPVSGVSPSLLISEMEIEKAAKSQDKPPILKPPLYDPGEP